MKIVTLGGMRIRTGEGVTFRLPLASPVSRGVALIIDLLLLVVISTFLYSGFNIISVINRDLSAGLMMVLQALLSIAYFVWFEWQMKGQTIGKKLLGLQVMDDTGLTLNIRQIWIRNLFRVVDMLPGFYAVGGATSIFNKNRKRLGDVVAGTIVVQRKKYDTPDLNQLTWSKYNSFKSYPGDVARFRQNINPLCLEMVIEALLRREEMEDAHRVKLYRELATALKDATTFPEEACQGLSDEQFLRNLVEVAYQ